MGEILEQLRLYVVEFVTYYGAPLLVRALACCGLVRFSIPALRLGLRNERTKEERDEFRRCCLICAVCLFVL